MKILFINIKGLLQTLKKSTLYLKGHQMKDLSQINNAYLLIKNDQGPMNRCLECNVDMGRQNPRQLCGKWQCNSVNY